jgi:CubicO group peptidase (beta-lactamase class C family)
MAMMLGSIRGMFRRRGLPSVRRKRRPMGEPLEPRTLLSSVSNPFDTPLFEQQFAQLLQDQNPPSGTVASLAFIRDGQVFTYGSPGTSADSLFRIGSITKTFTAAAIMLLVQDGKLSLDDDAFSVLGYTPDRRVTGYNPKNSQHRVGAFPAPGLFDITVQDLLAMTSGLPGEVTVTSRTFHSATTGPAIYKAGSYAALAFAGHPPYSHPATAQQQLNYAVYEISNYMKDHLTSMLPDPPPNQLGPAGTGYSYQDINYTVLGLIAAKLARQDYGLSYTSFLQKEILGPMGIAPPMAPPVTNNAMVGLGHTLESQKYPTEVTYVVPASDHDTTSIFPDHKRHKAPFYPPKERVPIQYGGSYWLQSHYGNGGLVATPTAVATFFANLSGTYLGTTTGPLTQQTVAEMVKEPSIGKDLPGGNGWFGLGMVVYSPASGLGVSWAKNGSLPGNSAMVYRYANGAVLAIELNTDLNQDGMGGTAESTYFTAVRKLVNEAAYGPAAIVASGGTPQSAPVNTTFAGALAATVTDAYGKPVDGAEVTFAAPSGGGAGGTFTGGQSTVNVTTNQYGLAIAPAFTANGTAGTYTVTATVMNTARGNFQADFDLDNQTVT